MYWNPLIDLLEKEKPDLAISLGDFGYWPGYSDPRQGIITPEEAFKNNKTKILFCPGNHEHWDKIDARNSDELLPNVFYMPRGSTYELDDGRKVLFFGGADSIDKKARKRHINWFEQEIPSYRNINNLPHGEKIDIVISHTAPDEVRNDLIKLCSHGFDLPDPTCDTLSYILNSFRPSVWYCGHWHVFFKKHLLFYNTYFTCLTAAGFNNGLWWEYLK